MIKDILINLTLVFLAVGGVLYGMYYGMTKEQDRLCAYVNEAYCMEGIHYNTNK